ncbi:MAG TPA: hypothetical protein VNX68_19520 [Nitrosopumilaceae archaeon]|jgi:hypothetical protein|nr:hypothetical protein [Nitrosopumilaceae archaeon]
METATIIVLTVLSTLSVVAIIALVVVSFYSLNRKVDTIEEGLMVSINKNRDDLELAQENSNKEIGLQFDLIKRELDSRCDKLALKIKTSITSTEAIPTTTSKVLLG